MIYVVTRAYFNPSIAPKPLEEEVPSTRVIIVQLLTSFVPLALLILSVLGSILTLAAVETSIAQGIMLLSFYSLGLAVPFVLSGYGITKFLSVSKNLRSKMRLI